MPWKTMMLLGISIACLAGCAIAPGEAPASPPAEAVRPAATQPPARPARRPPTAAPTTPDWRVAQDGTTGCADIAALRALRQPAEDAAALRALAGVRSSGGCVTVFRGQLWRLAERGEDVLRLSPAEPGATAPLWFWRDQVAEERGF